MMPRTMIRVTPLEEWSDVLRWFLRDGTYGKIPTAARTEGSERMPMEMVSATMTAGILVNGGL